MITPPRLRVTAGSTRRRNCTPLPRWLPLLRYYYWLMLSGYIAAAPLLLLYVSIHDMMAIIFASGAPYARRRHYARAAIFDIANIRRLSLFAITAMLLFSPELSLYAIDAYYAVTPPAISRHAIYAIAIRYCHISR